MEAACIHISVSAMTVQEVGSFSFSLNFLFCSLGEKIVFV